jgi:acetylornithine deacetylase/succinyl-diaminopimelate desuccinylase-like protein
MENEEYLEANPFISIQNLPNPEDLTAIKPEKYTDEEILPSLSTITPETPNEEIKNLLTVMTSIAMQYELNTADPVDLREFYNRIKNWLNPLVSNETLTIKTFEGQRPVLIIAPKNDQELVKEVINVATPKNTGKLKRKTRNIDIPRPLVHAHADVMREIEPLGTKQAYLNAENDHLYGRGTSDMLTALCSAIINLHMLCNTNSTNALPWLVITSDEEIAGYFSGQRIISSIKPTFAIDLESSPIPGTVITEISDHVLIRFEEIQPNPSKFQYQNYVDRMNNLLFKLQEQFNHIDITLIRDKEGLYLCLPKNITREDFRKIKVSLANELQATYRNPEKLNESLVRRLAMPNTLDAELQKLLIRLLEQYFPEEDIPTEYRDPVSFFTRVGSRFLQAVGGFMTTISHSIPEGVPSIIGIPTGILGIGRHTELEGIDLEQVSKTTKFLHQLFLELANPREN